VAGLGHIQELNPAGRITGAEAKPMPWLARVPHDRDEHQAITVDREVPLVTPGDAKKAR
jgi:hypothetical protein